MFINEALKRLLLVTIVACTPIVAHAAGQSYMSLVGKLVGAVESPRVLRDICARSVPDMAAPNAPMPPDSSRMAAE